MKRLIVAAVAVTCAAVPIVVGSAGANADTAGSDGAKEYVVLYAEGASLASARAAITSAGGTIVSENTDVGVATVQTSNAGFTAAVDASAAIDGTARNRVIGAAPDDATSNGGVHKFDPAEAVVAGVSGKGVSRRGGPKAAEPLADLQWDMQQIDATPTGSYRHEQGRGVKVGIIDTGVDGSHPDIAANFDRADSRNFTVDIPFDANGNEIDGPCEDEPDKSCNDPADVDEDGHGTHVASTIAAPINGIGIAGVAPQATIVNLRAGQDSGFFFLQPSVDALTYAAKHGIDVVNMSFYVDPWLFNCSNNPADSPEAQQEQRTIVTAMQRALDFAWARGVTLVSAAGNGATDYTKVITDGSSPDFADTPGEASYLRTIDPASCTSMPSEGNHVISVSATGISLRKAYYSDYGNGYIDVAAPGGDVYDTPDNNRDITKAVLAAYPESVGRRASPPTIAPDGTPTTSAVVKSCDASGKTCGYYQYLQGTSMASPHAAGVAALIVGKYGLPDFRQGGKTLFPDVVALVLKTTANKTPCPDPPTFTYTRNTPTAGTVVTTATCEGSSRRNGFYGSGVVDALRAVGH